MGSNASTPVKTGSSRGGGADRNPGPSAEVHTKRRTGTTPRMQPPPGSRSPSGDYATAHLRTVSQVRVVTSLPNVRSMSVMNTGPFGLGV